MRSFLSIPDEPSAATECGACAKGKEATEDMMVVTKKDDDNQESSSSDDDIEVKEGQTVVMSGPLGAAVTEALNKTLAKKTAGIGNESLSHVQANGQIFKPDEFVSRMRKSVGVVPATDDAPTVVNTMLDAASKVDEVDFVLVQSAEPPIESSQMCQKSFLFAPALARQEAGLEGYAVEQVQLVVKVRKVRTGSK